MADIKWDDEQPKAETPLSPSGPKIQFDEPADQKPTNPLAPTIDLKTGLPKNWFQRAADAVPQALMLGIHPNTIKAIGTASPAMAMPPGASVLGRGILNAAGGAAEAGTEIASRRLKNAFSQPTLSGLVTGETQQQPSPLDDLKTIGERAGMNALVGGLVGEPLAALGKLVPMTKAANALRGDYPKDVAGSIAQNLEQNVPALKGSKSLYDMVYGSGRQKVKDAFDASLEAVKENGKGKLVDLPIDVANSFGIEAKGGLGVAGLPADVQKLFAQSNKRTGMDKQLTAQATQTVKVDAAELADKMTGFGRKEPKGYRQAAEALDAAGLGDPAARQAYKYYTGMSNYIDKSGAFKGEAFDPQKLFEGASKLKNIDELRRRGIGSATEGPLANLPQKPEITSLKNPLAGHGWIGGMLGGGLGTTIAHGAGVGPLGHGLGFLAGAGLANSLPREIVTKAPISQGAQNAVNVTPGVVATLIRSILGQGQQQP